MVQIKLKEMTQNAEMEASTVVSVVVVLWCTVFVLFYSLLKTTSSVR